MEESQDHVKTDLPVNDQQPDEPIDPFDCQRLPSKDLPVFLSQLKDDENAQLRPPVPVEQLDFTHVQQMIGERAARALKNQLKSVKFQSLRHECYCITKIVDSDELVYLSRAACAQMLLISRQQFHSFVANYISYLNGGAPKAIGRPRLISDQQSKEIIDEIRTRQLKLHPMTITNLCNFIQEKYNIPCSRRFIRDWISRHKRDVMINFVKPAEKSRAAVKREDIQKFYDQIRELLSETDPALIYNCDETGFSRRITSTKLRAVLCTDAEPEKAVYIQAPDESSVTLLACVNLTGQHLRPYVIVPTKSVNKEILGFVRPNKECVFVCHPKGFSTHAIFVDWFREVFLPKVRRQREKMGCPNKRAVLIFDGFAGHESEALNALAADNHVLLIKIPPHSSHLTQPLDQQVFQTLKSAYRREVALEFVKDRMMKKICKLIKAFGESFLPHIIRQSWKSVGIQCEWNETGEVTKIIIDSEVVIRREIPTSPEIQASDKRKRMKVKAPFGPINLDAIRLVQNDQCPLCQSRRTQDPDVISQSTLLRKELEVMDNQDRILEQLEGKAMTSRKCLADVDIVWILEYLYRKGRLTMRARRHIDSLRERLFDWKIFKIVTQQTVRKLGDSKEMTLQSWTTSSKIASEVISKVGSCGHLPGDIKERTFRTLINLVTEGVLEKKDPELGAEGAEPISESEIAEFEFRLHLE